MENRRRQNSSSSGEMFSFPVINPRGLEPDQFEFGSVTTPGSPNSPADHLFSNGKLLPHVFPVQPPNGYSFSRSTSRTSSIGSKDSLMSSRSNSTNSRSSCSSARTSTSEANSERRLSPVDGNFPGRISVRKERNVTRPSQYQYGSCQRWQLIAAAPVLKHQGSRSRKVEVLERKGSKKSRENIDGDPGGAKSWFGRRILKSFVSACKECHAIKTSSAEGVLPKSLER
ncbi:uncharacterized protein LOC105165400 [Sesamum indicum]|uniref:Uncharacterized protein LOC105165400 n=1 Tax=Sesamum indicum TaxID=4182 RepID=A0A6I9TCS8_SESIN|nr:uncharacterized protein LOC105165400 [Sesamum indicum]